MWFTSVSRKSQALRHRTNGLYDAPPYMDICKPTGLRLANEILVRAHLGEKARLSASSSGKLVGSMVNRGSLVIVEQT